MSEDLFFTLLPIAIIIILVISLIVAEILMKFFPNNMVSKKLQKIVEWLEENMLPAM